MRTPSTDHLDPADAELVRALYLERWAGVSLAEATAVRIAATTARHVERHARHAGPSHHAPSAPPTFHSWHAAPTEEHHR